MAGNSSGSMKNVGVYAPYGRVRITNLNVGVLNVNYIGTLI